MDRTDALEEELYRHWRATHPLPPGERETLAYDLTSVLFFGVTCPLAELGYNAQDVEDQLQVNLGLLVNRSDTIPVSHALFEGSRHGVATVRNMLARLSRRPLAPGETGSRGTLVWDRGMVSKGHVVAVEEMGWQLICGLPKTLNAVQEVLDSTEVPARPGDAGATDEGQHDLRGGNQAVALREGTAGGGVSQWRPGDAGGGP